MMTAIFTCVAFTSLAKAAGMLTAFAKFAAFAAFTLFS
jgi:hypothetical protein